MRDRQSLINWSGVFVTVVLMGLLTFSLYGLVYQAIPDGNRDPFLVVVGMIVTKVGSIVDWHYGGSSTAKRQEETIGTLAETAKSAQAALAPTEPAVTLTPGESIKVEADAPKPGA